MNPESSLPIRIAVEDDTEPFQEILFFVMGFSLLSCSWSQIQLLVAQESNTEK